MNKENLKILLIGASGTIGNIIAPPIAQNHELLTAGRKSGDIVVDISDKESIANLFRRVKNVDAIICAAGDSATNDLIYLTEAQIIVGVNQKLLSQINLVLVEQNYLNENGSFTLTSGKMAEKPAKSSVGKAVANGGINSFVLAASLELPRGIRINVVRPTKVADLPGKDLVNAYLTSIATSANGEVSRIGYN